MTRLWRWLFPEFYRIREALEAQDAATQRLLDTLR